MPNYLLSTCEILLVVVMPLIVLYLKGKWPLRKFIPALVIIPVLWYFTYVPLHELSHAAGTYLVGGKAIEYKLIPRFWLGEFSGGWATPSGYYSKLATINVFRLPILAGYCLFCCSDICLQAIFFQESFCYWPGFHASMPQASN